MKFKSLMKTAAFFAGLLLLLPVSACRDLFTDPLTDKITGEKLTVLLVDLNVINTRFDIRLVDMATQEPVTNEGGDFEIQFIGNDSLNVITMSGKKPEHFLTPTDFLEVAYDPNLPVNEQDPIELTLLAFNSDYISAPLFVSFTEEGTKDIIIQMIRINSGKGVSLGAYDEPYDISFNGLLHSNHLKYINNISTLPTGTAYQYLNLYKNNTAGRLTCDNLSDPVLYSDYGIYYVGYSGSGTLVPPAMPSKDAVFQPNAYIYSSILKTGMEKCGTGLRIFITGANDKLGTAQFGYKISFADGSVKTGVLTSTLPSAQLVEPVYFPVSNPAVTVELMGNSQYSVSSPVTLANVCGGQARFTATPLNSLKAYKFVVRYICPNSMVGVALTIKGEFRKSNSTGAWSPFEFVQGVCILQLEQDADYDFRVSLNGVYHDYSLPTNPETMVEFITEHQNEDWKIRHLNITPTSTMVLVDADVVFSEEYCSDLLGRK